MGKSCADAIRECGFEVSEIDVDFDIVARLQEVRPDAAFNALLGRGGEDGAIQGLLEWMRIPYTHSGVLASALCMNKAHARYVYKQYGLPVAEAKLVHRKSLSSSHPMDPPYVIKPNSEGSSVGVQFVFDDGTRPPTESSNWSEWLLVEEFVRGQDLTVGVFQDKPVSVTAIHSPNSLYDYESKHRRKGVTYTSPAPLPAEVSAACLKFAETAHKALGCRFTSRTDFRWDSEKGADGLIILETNTQPGIGVMGSFDDQLTGAGITLPEFCRALLEDASLNR